MAAQLDITYTPQYVGCHRICFRTTQAQYCCYLDTSSSVIGTPKTVTLDLENFATCLVFIPEEISCTGTTPVTGYIQPCCSDENSNDNRVAFTASFVSTPCTSYNIECTESGVGEITIVNPGYGWPIGVVPNIIVNTSGSGFGFTATAIMECLPGDNFCSIDDIDITNPGEEYYYINELSVEVVPLPTCISNELITNGDFATDLSGWTLAPALDIFYWDSGSARYNNIAYGATTPGFISQDILTPGRTYEIRIDTIALGVTTGYCQLIISAGNFDISGTQPNQFTILRFPSDPLYTTPIFVTLTCVGSTSFNIYAYTTAITAASRMTFSDVSVIEVCTVIDPELEVSLLDDCGTFTVPNCDGTANATQYGILGGLDYAVNVCAGGAGPIGAKYNITENAIALPGDICFNLGTEAFGLYTCSISPAGTYNGKNYYLMVAPDCVTPYDAFIAPNAWTVWYSTGNGYVNQWVLSEGLNQYVYVQWYLPVSSSPNFPLGNWVIGPDSGVIDLLSTDTNCQGSCCNCKLYNVVVRNPIDIYYTDCNQTIDIVSVEPGIIGITVCAIPGSVWPANKLDTPEILAITEVGDCIPTE
jgi:hypothetical protein